MAVDQFVKSTTMDFPSPLAKCIAKQGQMLVHGQIHCIQRDEGALSKAQCYVDVYNIHNPLNWKI